MSVVVVTLSKREARSLTDEVKRDAERLWAKLLELYKGGAHEALDYKSWGDYFEAEFGGSRTRAYELLNAGRVLEVARQSGIPDSDLPRNEAQANELAPLLDKPDELRDTWAEVVEETSGRPTAAAVRRRVTASKTQPKSTSVEYMNDAASEDALRDLRTQLVSWFEHGAYIKRLLDEKRPLEPKSPEDTKSLGNDLKAMARVIKRLEEMI